MNVRLMTKAPRSRRSADDLQAMVAFARVVELRSFTAAGRSLETTTSAVSKRIAHLEERLGVRLLERTTRALSPTEAGLSFYDRCARILQDVAEAELAVTEIGSAPRGTLRVSASAVLGEGYLAPLSGQFLDLYQDLRLEVTIEDRLVSLVGEGYDVGVRAMRVGNVPDSSLVARRLGTVNVVVCASPTYLARRGTPRTPEDLRGHDILHFSPMPLMEQWSFETPEGRYAAPVTSRLSFNSLTALRGAAIAGAGLTRTSLLLVGEAVRAGLLTLVLNDYASADLGLYAVYPAGKQPLPKVKAYVDFLAAELPRRLSVCDGGKGNGHARSTGVVHPPVPAPLMNAPLVG